MTNGILPWLNENAKGPYPLSGDIGVRDLIVDASFIQYNNFIPVLKKLVVDSVGITFTIQFDKEIITFVKLAEGSDVGDSIRLYGSEGRYLGVVVFGAGVASSVINKAGLVVSTGIPFEACTVLSISKNSGVHSIESLFGDLSVLSTTSVFFGIDTDIDTGDPIVDFNAVSTPDAPDALVIPLKTLNGVGPVLNNINLLDSEVIKITPSSSGITFSLANSILNDSIGPTVTYA